MGDQDHGPLSGWLAERRLKKALPASQRKRRAEQSSRPAGKSQPRPSERPRPGESLPLRDVRFSPQLELAPDYLPTAADEPAEARQTADTKAEAASAGPGHERAEAASSLVSGGDEAGKQGSWEAEPQVASPADEGEPSAAQGEPLADQSPATADQAARSATLAVAAAPQADEPAGEAARIEAEPEAAGQAGGPEVPAQRPGSASAATSLR